MPDLYHYALVEVTALDVELDDDGHALPPGWFYAFAPGTVWVGPYTTSESAETAAEAELGELLHAN